MYLVLKCLQTLRHDSLVCENSLAWKFSRKREEKMENKNCDLYGKGSFKK